MKKGIVLLWFILGFVNGQTQIVQDDSLMILIKSDVHDTVKMSRTLEKLYSAPYDRLHYYNNIYLNLAKKALLKPNVPLKLTYDYLKGIASAYHNKGVFYTFDANLDSSVIALKKSIQLFELLKEEDEKPQVMVALANVYLQQGSYEDALNYGYKALSIFEKKQNFYGMGYAQNSMAYVYNLQDDYEQVIAFLSKSLVNYEKANDMEGMLDCVDKLYVAYDFLDQDDDALKILEKGIELINKNKVDSLSAEQEMLYLFTARSYNLKQAFDLSVIYHKKAIYLSELNGNLAFLSSRNLDLARTYFDLKDYKNALIFGNEAYEIAKERHEKESEYVIAGFLGNVYELTKDYEKAYQMQKTYSDLRESVQRDEDKKLLVEKEVQYEFEKKEIINRAAQVQEISKINLAAEKKNARKNTWLIGMAIFLCFLVIAIYFIYKFQRQKTIIASQNAHLLKQKLLISQMNPHFIFNALNAIQNFILKKDPLAASGYLANFSTLVRMILDFSRKDFIDLQSELKFLKNYLDLQQLRTNNNFEYRFEFDETVEPDLIAVPPMLTQPFIENAIEHGGFDAQNKGLIIIRYKINGDDLTCEIEDNGIGMENSLGIKTKKSSTHESLALKITEERIETLYPTKQNKGIQILDKKNISPDKSGVLISFTIPLTEV